MKDKFQLVKLLILILISGVLWPTITKASNLIEDGHNPNHHVEVLDPEGKYKLEWLVDWDGERIFFNVTVETRGFIKFGISKDDMRKNPGRQVDLVIGGVDIKGTPYFTDRYSVGNGVLIVDDKQDWELITASETGGFTFLSFSRLFNTDDSQDIAIDSTLIIVWGYGEEDYADADDKTQATSHSGNVLLYLRDPNLTPLIIQGNRSIEYGKIVEGSDVKVWSLSANFDIPQRRSTYWCRIFKKNFLKKQHLIGWTFDINDETKGNVHHMLFLYCRVPNAASIYDKYVDTPGEDCYNEREPDMKPPFRFCFQFKAGFAIGERSVFLPDSMGVPVGETGATEYFLLQVHYDNANGRSDLRSQLIINAYHTEKLRANDGGLLALGEHVPGSPSILLPPGLRDHRIHGDCSSECTRKMLPQEGIKIVAVVMHAHNAAVGMTARHFRGDQELAPIVENENWKYNFQPARLLRNEVTILPGDQIRITCHYDTTSINRTTVGGHGADQEMCNIFAYYYTLLEDYPLCRSELISPTYAARYLTGLKNVSWNKPHFEWVATEPKHLKGLTISEISDSEYVNWSDEQRAMLQKDHDDLPQVPVCPDTAKILGNPAILAMLKMS